MTDMPKVADKLREARALIERGWTQHVFARAADGRPAAYDGPDAKCFCVVGALSRVGAPSLEWFAQMLGKSNCSRLAKWNDAPERTQAEVLAAFDKAILLAEAQS